MYHGLVSDDPCIVAGRHVVGLAGTNLDLRAVVRSDRQATLDDVPDVLNLAGVGARLGLAVHRPAAAGLHPGASDLLAVQVDELGASPAIRLLMDLVGLIEATNH